MCRAENIGLKLLRLNLECKTFEDFEFIRTKAHTYVLTWTYEVKSSI